MHSFAVLIGKDGAVSPDRVEKARAAVGRLLFEPETASEWATSTKQITYLGWQSPHVSLDVGSHWDINPRGVTGFTGWAWLKTPGSPHRSWAAQLAEYLDGAGLDRALEELYGSYTLVRLADDDTGYVAADPFGIGLLYRGDTPDVTVVSSRADVVAAAITRSGPPARDLTTMGWLPFFGYPIGDGTGFEGVKALPQATYLALEPGGARTKTWRPRWWTFTDQEQPPDVDDLAELVLEDVRNNLRSISRLSPSRPILNLSGGKDSRLILASAVSAGLHHDLSYTAFGLPANGDAILAHLLASRYGLDLTYTGTRTASMSAETFERRLRAHVFQNSALFGVWDLQGANHATQVVRLTGALGELFRSHYAPNRTLSTEQEVTDFFVHRVSFDPAGLLKPDAAISYRSLVLNWVNEQLEAGVLPEDVPDLFYLQHRVHRWLGANYEVASLAPQALPLKSLLGLRAAFCLRHSTRRTGRLLFEAMRRAEPELTKVPLEGKAWDPDVYSHLPDAEDYAAMRAFQPPAVEAATLWQDESWPAIREVFRDRLSSPSNPIFSILDYRRVHDAVEGRLKLPALGQRVALFATLGAAVWLSSEEQELRFSSSPVPNGSASARRPPAPVARETPEPASSHQHQIERTAVDRDLDRLEHLLEVTAASASWRFGQGAVRLYRRLRRRPSASRALVAAFRRLRRLKRAMQRR